MGNTEYTLELAKFGDGSDRSLVVWVKDGKIINFLTCSYYQPDQPVGQQWCWGHYFDNLMDAVNFMNETKEN